MNKTLSLPPFAHHYCYHHHNTIPPAYQSRIVIEELVTNIAAIMMSAPPPPTTTTAPFTMASNWHSAPTTDFDNIGATSSTANAPFDFEFGEGNATTWPENPYVTERRRVRNSSSKAPEPHPRAMKSTSATNASGNPGFHFVTATNPADFKEKGVMQQVRKKAMNNYLEKKPRPYHSPPELHKKRSRSRDSSGSISRPNSKDGKPQELEETINDIIANDQALKILRGEGKRKKSFRQASNPVYSIHSISSTNDEQTAVSTESASQVTRRDTPSLLIAAPSVMTPAPIFMPMRRIKLPYDLYMVRPFQSIGKPLDPFRAMHQASHPRVGVEELKFYCSRIFGTRAMGVNWIPIITSAPHTFLSTLCISSAHWDAMNNRSIESIQTTALRQEIIHLINQSLVNPQKRVDDLNVVALTQLICCEIIAGGDAALDYHETGVEAMVKQRGGLERLGRSGWVAKVLAWVSLESSVLRDKQPRQMFLDYWKTLPKNTYPNTATVPESPLWCPRTEFETLKRSGRCSARTYDILKDVRTMTDLFLSQNENSTANTHRSRDNSLKTFYKKITNLPSIHDLKPNAALKADDWTYEACRIAAVIYATAISKRIPFSQAVIEASSATSSSSSTSPARSASQQQHRLSIVSTSSAISPTNTRTDSPIDVFSFSPNALTSPSATSTSISTSSSTSLLSSLKKAIDSSSLGAAWAETNLTGVLLWLALITAPASLPTPSSVSKGATSTQPLYLMRKWFNALAVRCSILLCFEHPEGVLGTMGRMALVQEKLRSESGGVVVGGRGRSSVDTSKKRRTS